MRVSGPVSRHMGAGSKLFLFLFYGLHGHVQSLLVLLPPFLQLLSGSCSPDFPASLPHVKDPHNNWPPR